VAASVLFAAIFLLAARLDAFTAFELTAWRVLGAAALVTALLARPRARRAVAALLRRLRRAPALVLVLALDGLLLGLQLFLFAWSPQSGHGLDASLGYLLLPLVMVLVGLGHGERLSAPTTFAVALAAIGVAAGVVFAGGISWVTAAIALGYPLYFACRRRAALDTLPAFLGELVVLLPVAVVVLAQPHSGRALAGHPDRLGGVLLLAALGAVAFVLYLGASSRLPFGVFGLLTYLEPALLVVVSTTALGEPLEAGDAVTFGPIVAALLLLASTRLTPPRRGRPRAHAD
jgi:chloramphenicol-sensitive protein RarD